MGIELLLLLAFLNLDLTPAPKPQAQGGTLSVFDVAADHAASPRQSLAKQAPAPPRAAPHPVPPPLVVLPPRKLDLMVVDKATYAAADISKLGTAANPQLAQRSGASAAGSASPGDSERVGTGPNGEPLYAAEWVREPTHQELSTYLPKAMPDGGGWGLVACRTVAAYHVDDCVELGDGPLGSHLARAVRLAAWQFLVRPPRVGGKPLVGEWVRIRIDYGVSGQG